MTPRAIPARPNTPKPRKKWPIVLLAFAGVLLLALIVALGYAQSRYEAVFRAPRVQHEAFTTGNTALKIIVKPPLAQRRIATLLLPRQSLPDWLLNMTVPEETALLFDPDLDQSVLRVRMFINYARLGPVIRDSLNSGGVTQSLPGIQWAPPEVVMKQPGVLLLEGSAPISREAVTGTTEQWIEAGGFSPPPIEGTHVFEAALENRNGKGYATLMALAELNGPLDPKVTNFFNPMTMFSLGSLHVYADFVDPDTLAVNLLGEANPGAGPDAPKHVKFYIDAIQGLISGELRRKYGAELEGKSTIEGDSVRGVYTIKGIDALLARMQAAE